MYSKEERIEKIEEARQLMEEAMALLTDAVEDTEADSTFNNYTVPTIEVLIKTEHQWLASNHGNLDDLIDEIEEEGEEDYEWVDDGDYPGQYMPVVGGSSTLLDDWYPDQPLDHLPGALNGHPTRLDKVRYLRSEYDFTLYGAMSYAPLQ